jgi:2-polyprenyl-3-methyl-5-hydroxy-6-metoxy-1,4-benzoquinol methylase
MTELVIDYELVACDLCGASARESVPVFDGLRDMRFGIPGQFTLHRCNSCGLLYLSPRPTRETISAYYPGEYSGHKGAIEDEWFPIMRWIRRRKLSKRRRLIEHFSSRKQGRVLDVGCATGLFLNEMAQAGWQAAGVELTASAVEYARRRFGLDVFEGTLGESPYEPASFDVITFWDVLEHTFSPTEELTIAARLLRPGGLLVLNVPNWNSVNRRLFGRYWSGLDAPRHLYVFTYQTLETLLSRAGFSVIDRRCFIPGYSSFVFSIQFWLGSRTPRLSKGVVRVLNVPGMRFLFEPWFTLLNWLGQGVDLSIFATNTG